MIPIDGELVQLNVLEITLLSIWRVTFPLNEQVQARQESANFTACVVLDLRTIEDPASNDLGDSATELVDTTFIPVRALST